MQIRVAGGAVLVTELLVAIAVIASPPSWSGTLTADPHAAPGNADYYRTLVSQLEPGDTLMLLAGTYRERLNLSGIQGRPDAWITVTGPESGPPAIITTQSTCCNTVQLGETSFVAIKNLTIDSNSDGVQTSIDGINAKDGITHDILIENCVIRGVSYHQQTVGISTKSAAWNWTIRRNTIIEAGTGMYLGSSDGTAPFIAGVIEGNLILDTIGYNVEIKYQRPYTASTEMPAGPHRTIIRNNVFIKRRAQSEWPPSVDGGSRLSGARPSLLVGGFPNSGTGANDLYEIYANFFYMNPDESLLQVSGRVTIHDNILARPGGTAIQLQNHDLPLKLAELYNNTIYGVDRGIRFGSSATEGDSIVGNLVFAANPISGSYRTENERDNITDSVANAPSYVSAPSFVLGEMDFYPLADTVTGAPLDLSRFAAHTDYTFDFNGGEKGDLRFRGAYAGEGSNPGWQLGATLKEGGPGGGGDGLPPDPPRNLRSE